MELEGLRLAGQGLHRPECVLALRDGAVLVSDWRGGVTRIAPDGRQHSVLAGNIDGLRPNGIALDRDGSVLLANLGEAGGVWRLRQDGHAAPFCTEVEGRRLPPCNFVAIDRGGRVWITVSTRLTPRALGYRPDVADGFIVLVDHRGPRIVADGLGYTNEAHVHPSGQWLYVTETFGRRLTRFRLDADGGLADRETVAVFGPGTFPDGLAFDEDGGAWVVSIVSNRVIRVAEDGVQRVLLEDSDPEWLAEVETAFREGRMGRPHLDQVRSRVLANVSSVALGGPDGRTAWFGCLLGDRLAVADSPFRGAPPSHWEWS